MPVDAAIAIDIGGTTTKIALVSSDGQVGPVSSFQTEGPASAFLDKLASRLGAFDAGVVGVSVAGFVNDAQSSMVYNPNIGWLERFPLRAELEDRTKRSVAAFDADSNAAAYGEYVAGAGRGSKRFLCISIGTGVGGGMIVDGEILRIAHGGLGDIGHVNVYAGGPRCGAGCRGCAESMISAQGLRELWRSKSAPPAREIIEMARAGNEDAKDILVQAGRLLAFALATYTVIFFPDTIAIAGGISEAGDLLLSPAQVQLHSTLGPAYSDRLKVVKSRWGWRAPLVGAGLLALRH